MGALRGTLSKLFTDNLARIEMHVRNGRQNGAEEGLFMGFEGAKTHEDRFGHTYLSIRMHNEISRP